jgi:hypothetical protein
MGSHDDYGKKVLQRAVGDSFASWGAAVEVDYRAGQPARIDGVVAGTIAVEVESRTSKQVRGAVLDLVFHRCPKKLLVLLPVHMSDAEVAAEQCRFALGRFVGQDDFRVVVTNGSGHEPRLEDDTELVLSALRDLGFAEAA